VVLVWDLEGVGVAYKTQSQPHLLMMMEQYWLGKNNPK